MPKISFIGAGSTVFAKNLLGDILSFPELAESTISLHDIDPERLRTSEIVARKIAAALGVSPTIEATLDRRQSLAGADYAIAMVPGGRLSPQHGDRFRDSQEATACGRPSPTRWASAALCAPCAPSPCCWR
jgi:alpha-galactosidase/6-phospho-beta-glucosidase family protein